jgi:hypothetical protein
MRFRTLNSNSHAARCMRRPGASRSLLNSYVDIINDNACEADRTSCRRARRHHARMAKVRDCYSCKLGPPGEIGDLLFANSPCGPAKAAKAARSRLSGSAYHSVGAGIRPGARRVIRVIRAIEAVVVVAADEMTPSSAKVIVVQVGHATGAKATDVASAKTSDVTTAKSTHVTSAKATHVASAKATHVPPTTTTVSSSAAAAPSLCTRGNKAAGKQCACQNHHRSSSHNILHLAGRTFRHRALSDVGPFEQTKRQRCDGLDMGIAILPPY